MWLIGGAVSPASIPPSRASVTLAGLAGHAVVIASILDSAPAQDVCVPASYCLMFLFQFTLGECVYMILIHSQVVALLVPPWDQYWQAAHHVHIPAQ